jgi:hypothetical protein
MLSVLFGSAAKAKILNFFLLNPEKTANISELSKILALGAAIARRETENLVKIGLIKEVKEKIDLKEKSGKITGKNRRFRATENFILYPEIKALLIKARILPVQKLLDNLGRNCQLKLLLLTGVFVNRSDAPIDLLIVGTLPRRILTPLINGLEKDLDREINFTILTEKEYNYRREVMDIFLYNVLEGENLILINNLT